MGLAQLLSVRDSRSSIRPATLGQRGFAVLTERWRAPATLHHQPSKIGGTVKAALVLTHFEHGRLT
jgi:hypothetical protein